MTTYVTIPLMMLNHNDACTYTVIACTCMHTEQRVQRATAAEAHLLAVGQPCHGPHRLVGVCREVLHPLHRLHNVPLMLGKGYRGKGTNEDRYGQSMPYLYTCTHVYYTVCCAYNKRNANNLENITTRQMIIIGGASLSELVSRARRLSRRDRTSGFDDGRTSRKSLGLAAAGAGVRVIGADEACKLWPLEVGCTVCEEDGGQTNCVYHMAMRRLRCLNQYCLVPRREVA